MPFSSAAVFLPATEQGPDNTQRASNARCGQNQQQGACTRSRPLYRLSSESSQFDVLTWKQKPN